MFKKLSVLAAMVMVVGLSFSASAQKFTTKSGTKMLGGSASFGIDSVKAGEADSVSGFVLNLAPSMGYFISDNFALLGEVAFTKKFGDLYEKSATDLGLGVGAKYFFSLGGSLTPYVGLMVSPKFTFPDEGDTATWLNLGVPAGLLLALNDWVAIDLGLRLNMNIGLSDSAKAAEKMGIHIPVGYFGVQSVF